MEKKEISDTPSFILSSCLRCRLSVAIGCTDPSFLPSFDHDLFRICSLNITLVNSFSPTCDDYEVYFRINSTAGIWPSRPLRSACVDLGVEVNKRPSLFSYPDHLRLLLLIGDRKTRRYASSH